MALITTTRAIELQPSLASYSTAEIAATVDAVSSLVESKCGRLFGQSSVVDEIVETDQYGYAYIKRFPIVSGSFTLNSYTGGTITAFILNNESGELQTPAFRLQRLKATYTGGNAVIPVGLEMVVAALTVRALSKLARAGGASSIEIGSIKTAFSVTGSQSYDLFDATTAGLLAPYIYRGLN